MNFVCTLSILLIAFSFEVTLDKVASLYVNGQNKELLRAKLALDPVNFMDSDYNVDTDEIKAFIVSFG